ncbi:MAG: HNH nuclease family protein [Betaproteobacteria bacterium]|nr:HNH nuclease family protein [Betaproteobacteria bacterium]
MPSNHAKSDSDKLDRIVAEARRNRELREKTYREQALKIHPWICARCTREFTRASVHLLTVHHKDHNHDNNPPDGSNWELLCNYCHENEHSRYLDNDGRVETGSGAERGPQASYKPFAALKDLLKGKQ